MEENKLTIFEATFENGEMEFKVNIEYGDQESITEIIILSLSHIVTMAIFFRKHDLMNDISKFPQFIITLSQNMFGKDFRYNPIYSNARIGMRELTEEYDFEKLDFKIQKFRRNNFTDITINDDMNLNAYHYLLSMYALITHAYRVLDIYAKEGTNTVKDLEESERFEFYKKCTQAIEHVGFSIFGCARVIKDDEGNAIMNDINKVLYGQKDNFSLYGH